MAKFVQEYTIRSVEMGTDYLLKKSEAARFFQETFALYCNDKHVAAFDIIKDNLIWVVADMNIEFTGAMPFWGEEIRVEVWLSEITKLRIFSDFKIFYKNEVIAKGDSCWFLLNAKTKRPVNPNLTLQNFEVEDELVFSGHTKHSFEPFGEKIVETSHKVSFFDLDFNNHVNNLCYTSIAIQAMPIEYLAKNTIKSYKIKFLKECFLNDELICTLFKQNDNFFAELKRKSDDLPVCVIETEWIKTPLHKFEAAIIR